MDVLIGCFLLVGLWFLALVLAWNSDWDDEGGLTLTLLVLLFLHFYMNAWFLTREYSKTLPPEKIANERGEVCTRISIDPLIYTGPNGLVCNERN